MASRIGLLGLLLLTGCGRDHLFVRSEFVNHNRLASVRINTPDPLKECPYYGQWLVVHWNIDRCLLTHGEEAPYLELSIVFTNLEKERVKIPLCEPRGDYIYRLMNEEYDRVTGILTYKVELISDGEVVERWTHHTWAEWIDPDA